MISYCINDRPLYMFMAANSIKMLREYNTTIPVRVVFIEQDLEDRSENGLYLSKQDFLSLCEDHSVEIERRLWRSVVGHDNYFLINKTYVMDNPSSRVLFLDADTFVFGDVAEVIETYQHYDVSGCMNAWMNDWDENYLSIKALNSGVVLFSNDWHRNRSVQWIQCCQSLQDQSDPISNWLARNNRDHNREEMALSKLVAMTGAKCGYFEPRHVLNALWPQQIKECRSSIVFHPYTVNWKRVFREVTGTQRKASRRLLW